MKIILALFAVLLFASGVEAATATWGPNDTVADFAGTRVYRAPGPCSNPGPYALVGTFPRPAQSGVLANPTADGVYCHRSSAIDTTGNESLFSNTAEHPYNVVPPRVPQTFDVVD